ncbi:MAG: DUF4393 domain-containing protein [Bacteroidota bacterium]|nr:DUF4393 domain-containing protein [Bacteroidota bacterium]
MDKMEIKDLLGLEPIGEMGLEVTKASIKGITSFLDVVFKPGLQELGFLFKDEVRRWRLNNILSVLDKAKGKLDFDGQQLNLTANARVGLSIMEECSSVDNEELQDLWAGLFASSCTPDGRDDSNMNFVDLLRRMSTVEARILDYACKNCKKYIYPNKLIVAEELVVSFERLVEITGTNDIYRLDSELDHMRSLELLPQVGSFESGGGFFIGDNLLDANISPSSLALTLYYRTHSTGVSPIEFWGDQLEAREIDGDDEKLATAD